MASTTNFNWTTPDDTDLVKDGAAAIRTLGSAIDTSLVDLKGGTTGQVLSKTSNTDMDFTWVAQDDSNAIQNAIIDAKGDLIVGTAADTPARLAVGADTYVLTADSAEASGIKWAVAPSSGMTLLSTTSLSGASTTISAISGAYKNLQIDFENVYAATDATQLYMRINSDTGNNYAWYTFSVADGASASGTTAQLQLSKMRNSSTTGAGTVMLWNYASSVDKAASWSFNYSDTNVIGGWGAYSTTSAISSITFLMATGNISGGTVKIYGVK